MTSDSSIRDQIKSLVDLEHELREQHANGAMRTDDEKAKLTHVEAELDQCWDLLRQRQARRDAGESPDEAKVRPETTVEGYIG